MALHAAIAWSAFARDGRAGLAGPGHALRDGQVCVRGRQRQLAARAPRRSSGPSGAIGRPAPRSTARRRCVRLAGHADVRWHLWIVLAALGRLDAALVAYAVYFPARTLAGAVRKAVRHG